MEDEPIYAFDGLKQFLTDLGYQVGEAQAYRPIVNSDVELSDRGNMEMTSDGIFYIDPLTGSRQQIFLYKRRYRLTEFGKPRFHIRECQVIKSFMESGGFKREYRKANTKIVRVIDMDDYDRDKDISDLPLCGYCRNMALVHDMTTRDFVEILEQANQASADDIRSMDVDIFGYTRDWESISKAVRESKEYTCEECGLKMENPFDYQYMHTHHKDGNKLNNNPSNLECVCVYCHAHKPGHFERLTSGANKIIYDEFCERFYKSDETNYDLCSD